MYKLNKSGPWPIVDPSAEKIYRSTGAAETAFTSPLLVCLDTPNLGTKTEAFINGAYSATFAQTGQTNCSFGVCLTPLENIITLDTTPVVVDVAMGACSTEIAQTSKLIPFIGFIDVAGASIAADWEVGENLVTDWVPLHSYDNGASMNFCSQVILKDIISGGLDLDKFLCVGFTFQCGAAGVSWDNLDYMISARYALSSMPTSYRGV